MAPSTSSRAGTISLLFAVGIIHQLGTGIIYTLIPLRLALDGVPASLVGLISTAWSIGFLAGCTIAPRIIAFAGAKLAILAPVLANAAAALLLWSTSEPIAWAASRAVSGVSTSILFVLIEAWIASLAPPSSRGVVFGSYMLTHRITFLLGQLLFTQIDPRIEALFLIAACFYLLAPLPSVAIGADPPAIAPRGRSGLLEMAREAPSAALAALAHGMLTTVGPTLFPVHGVASGLSAQQIAWVLAALQFGGLVLQLPLTRWSDRRGRRSVMAVTAVAIACASLALWAMPSPGMPTLLVLACVWGGAPSVLYALAAAHTNDRARDEQRTSWSASLMFTWGIGATLAPLIVAPIMDAAGTPMLFVFSGVISCAFAIFLAWRKRVRSAVRKPSA